MSEIHKHKTTFFKSFQHIDLSFHPPCHPQMTSLNEFQLEKAKEFKKSLVLVRSGGMNQNDFNRAMEDLNKKYQILCSSLKIKQILPFKSSNMANFKGKTDFTAKSGKSPTGGRPSLPVKTKDSKFKNENILRESETMKEVEIGHFRFYVSKETNIVLNSSPHGNLFVGMNAEDAFEKSSMLNSDKNGTRCDLCGNILGKTEGDEVNCLMEEEDFILVCHKECV